MPEYNRLKELTILYVEDEQDVMEEIVDMLSIKVSALHTAKNGKEALDIFNNEDIDIIITDIQMPVMDGMEFLEKVREIDLEIPAIITTAFTEVEYLKRSIDLHVDKYITKPIDMMQLFRVLDRASNVVIQKREIEQRDLVIKKMLEMKPYYSIIIDKKNIDNLCSELLRPIGFNKKDPLNIQLQSKEGKCKEIYSVKELINEILDFDQNSYDDTICLSKECEIEELYLIKTNYFEGTNLFMVSFFDKNAIEKNMELQTCFKCINNKCK